MAKREFLQLAHVYDPAKHRIGAWFCSEKLDGMRAFWDGGFTRGMECHMIPFANVTKHDRYVTAPKATGLWSRYGQPIQAPPWWLDQMPTCPLDGELYMGRGKFQQLVSAVKKLVPEDSDWEWVEYMAFDSPAFMEIFANGEINNTNFKKNLVGVEGWARKNWHKHGYYPWRGGEFSSRCAQLKIELAKCAMVAKFHPQFELPWNEDEAKALVSTLLEQTLTVGGEGLMLRKPSSLWVPQRTHTLLKVKGMQDAEAIVIGYTWGRETALGSKLLGKMGALVVNFRGKRLELSGFTDEERRLTHIADGSPADGIGVEHPGEQVGEGIHNPRFPIGREITFRFRELTDDGIPKEARYWR